MTFEEWYAGYNPARKSDKERAEDAWNAAAQTAAAAQGDARVQGLIAAADYIDGPASGYAAEHSYTEPRPMAKVAAALRQKAEQEYAAYQARRSDQGLMESEWGPMEDAPPHEDPPMHVAVVEGDDAVRTLQWNRDVAAFAYPVGTLLYAARSQATVRTLRANGYAITPPDKPLTFEDVVPLTEAPPEGMEYWVVSAEYPAGVLSVRFSSDEFDGWAIKRRMAYLDKEHALVAARHIFGLKGGEL